MRAPNAKTFKARYYEQAAGEQRPRVVQVYLFNLSDVVYFFAKLNALPRTAHGMRENLDFSVLERYLTQLLEAPLRDMD
jgi:hypothetical protein